MPGDRSAKWPSAKEIRYNPANWDVSDEANALSNDADGWDNGKQDAQTTPGELVDWHGGFAPPPADWHDRKQFSHVELSNSVRIWQKDVHAMTAGTAAGGQFQTPQAVLLGHETSETAPNNVICPTEWAFKDICGVPVAECWKQNLTWLRQNEPHNILDGSAAIEPFWKRFVGPQQEMVQPPEVPDDRCDPEDVLSQQNKEQRAETSARERAAVHNAQKEKKRAKRHEVNSFRAEQRLAPGVITEHTPQVNMYIRPVEERDMVQLTEIMNYNITDTINVPEMSRLSSTVMNERRLDIQDSLLPFLVAVERSAKGGRRQGVINVDPRQELVIGMAFADDYSDRSNMFRYTVEIECFVRQEYMHKKVGSALMDKMLSALDPHYAGFGGYDYIGQHEIGDKRVVKNILANVHLDMDDHEKLHWCESWLKRFGFERKGEFAGNGRKLGKIVDTYMFWKVTGSHIPFAPR